MLSVQPSTRRNVAAQRVRGASFRHVPGHLGAGRARQAAVKVHRQRGKEGDGDERRREVRRDDFRVPLRKAGEFERVGAERDDYLLWS